MTSISNTNPQGVVPHDGYMRAAQLVPHVLPISRATLFRWVKDGKFPAPVKLGEKVSAWRAQDVREWMQGKAEPNGSE